MANGERKSSARHAESSSMPRAWPARSPHTCRKPTFPRLHGDALMDLAEVLRLAGRPSEATPLVRRALDLYTQKGHLVSADKARQLLLELEKLVLFHQPGVTKSS